MRQLIDLTGRRFGKLKVIKRAPINDRNQPTWLCKCDCGNEIIVRGDQLRYKRVKSCGCQKDTNNLIKPDFLNMYSCYLLWCLVSGKNNKEEWKENYKDFYNWIK